MQASVSKPRNADVGGVKTGCDQERVVDAFLKSYDHGALVNQDRRAGVDEVEKELLERSWGQEQPTRLRSSRCVVARAAADGLRGHSTFM